MGVAVIGTIFCDAVLCGLYCALYFVAVIHSDRDSCKPCCLSCCSISVAQLMKKFARKTQGTGVRVRMKFRSSQIISILVLDVLRTLSMHFRMR
jgi:hypothetical protein